MIRCRTIIQKSIPVVLAVHLLSIGTGSLVHSHVDVKHTSQREGDHTHHTITHVFGVIDRSPIAPRRDAELGLRDMGAHHHSVPIVDVQGFSLEGQRKKESCCGFRGDIPYVDTGDNTRSQVRSGFIPLEDSTFVFKSFPFVLQGRAPPTA